MSAPKAKYKIKIVHAANGNIWYANKIGRKFDATVLHAAQKFEVIPGFKVLPCDCLVMDEMGVFTTRHLSGKTLKISLAQTLISAQKCITTKELLSKGLSCVSIAAKVGISDKTVKKIKKSMDVFSRSYYMPKPELENQLS